jgi:predicted nucleic acid-binding protein
LDTLVVAEVIYVLTGGYARNRTDVANALLSIIQNAGVETVEDWIMTDALHKFATVNVDFADAWLAARAAHQGWSVVSFDRDFDKFKDIKRVEPKA